MKSDRHGSHADRRLDLHEPAEAASTRPRFTHLVGRIIQLDGLERRLCFAALMSVVLIRASLWTLPTARVLKIVDRIADRSLQKKAKVNGAAPQQIGWAVRAVSRRVPKASCLTQALAARILLARNGHGSVVRIGVAKDEAGAFAAHAWTEVDGVIIVGRQGAHGFRPFPDLWQVIGAREL